jgi:hypothetical protein
MSKYLDLDDLPEDTEKKERRRTLPVIFLAFGGFVIVLVLTLLVFNPPPPPPPTTDEPTEEPTDEPTDEPAGNVIVAPAANTAGDVAGESAGGTTDEPTDEPDPTDELIDEPTPVVTVEGTEVVEGASGTEEPQPGSDEPVCGDGYCDTAHENNDLCPQDCQCVDNGECEPGEGDGCRDCGATAGGCGNPCADSSQCAAGLSCHTGVCWACQCGGEGACDTDDGHHGDHCHCQGSAWVCDGKVVDPYSPKCGNYE